MQTAREIILRDDDDLWQRMEKLYVLICSVGDQIYTAGSGVGRLTLELRDLNKRIDELEQPVRDLRKEFDSIKQQLLTRANEQN